MDLSSDQKGCLGFGAQATRKLGAGPRSARTDFSRNIMFLLVAGRDGRMPNFQWKSAQYFIRSERLHSSIWLARSENKMF